MSIRRRPREDMGSQRSATLISQPLLMNSGKREAVQTDHRKKIGSMPQSNCAPALAVVDPVLGDNGRRLYEDFRKKRGENR